MKIEVIFFWAIPVLFSTIHLIEFSSYFSRISGLRANAKITGYSIQQIAFVFTRFFFVAMMPMIGFIVDKKISSESYILMVHFSLLGAFVFYLVVFACANSMIERFTRVISSYGAGEVIWRALAKLAKNKSEAEVKQSKPLMLALYLHLKDSKECRRIFWQSAIVFLCYSIAVFISFFAALHFYNYRSAIGQMSGVINAFATIMLSFYIEPNLSRSIDRNSEDAEFMIYSMLLGRILGVGILAQLLIAFGWLLP